MQHIISDKTRPKSLIFANKFRVGLGLLGISLVTNRKIQTYKLKETMQMLLTLFLQRVNASVETCKGTL